MRHFGLVAKVELLSRRREDVRETGSFQSPEQGRPDEPAVAGDVDPRILMHLDYQRDLQCHSRRDGDAIKRFP
jgi:hypothetical protein